MFHINKKYISRIVCCLTFFLFTATKRHIRRHTNIYTFYIGYIFSPFNISVPIRTFVNTILLQTHTHIFEVRLNGFVADFSHWMLSRAQYNTEPPRRRAMHMRPMKLHFFFHCLCIFVRSG